MGDLYPDQALRPANDRFYGGAKVAAQWGRLGLTSSYSLFGYDFDGDFTSYGADHESYNINGSFNLDGFWVFEHLKTVPFLDPSLTQNLNLNWGYDVWYSRDLYADPATGILYPLNAGSDANIGLGNDEKSKLHFNFWVGYGAYDDQWSGSRSFTESYRLRLPVPSDMTAQIGGRLEQDSNTDKTVNQSGTGWSRSVNFKLEKYFKGNLYVYANGQAAWSQKSWQGVWGWPDEHFKWTAGMRQSFGANMSVEVDYGYPALGGYDFGIQDTINVVTASMTAYF